MKFTDQEKLKSMINENFKRVFFHEMGHHIARKLNYLLYKKGAGTKEIFLEEIIINGEIEYLGGTTANIPIGYIDDEEIKDLPQYIAVLLYGCIFQTIYESVNFRSCFSIRSDANGHHDAKAFRSLEKYITGPKRKRIVEYVETEYIQHISKNSMDLNIIFELEIENFIQKSESYYYLKLGTLDRKISNFLDHHSKYYEMFINEVIDIKN